MLKFLISPSNSYDKPGKSFVHNARTTDGFPGRQVIAAAVASSFPMIILPMNSGPFGARHWFWNLAPGTRHEATQRRHHRPRRPRQDHPGRPAAAAGGLVPREPAGG